MTPWFGCVPRLIAVLIGWLGVAFLGTAPVVIGPTTDYAGLASLLPRLGAVAIFASGGWVGSPSFVVLAGSHLRWLGRISYLLHQS